MTTPHLLHTLTTGSPPLRVECWGTHHPDDQPGQPAELEALTVIVVAQATGRAWKIHPDHLPEPFVAAVRRELGGLEHGHDPEPAAAAECWISQAADVFGLSTDAQGVQFDPAGWTLIRAGSAEDPAHRGPQAPGKRRLARWERRLLSGYQLSPTARVE